MAEARILYVATDDGLIQFANPGRSDRWREVGRALEHQLVRAVAAAPNDPLLIVAAAAAAVHRTTDGGFSWEPIWQGAATALAVADDGTLYVGTKDGLLLRSVDGRQWEDVLRAAKILEHMSVAADQPHAGQRADLIIKRLMASVGQRIVCCTATHVYDIDFATQQRVATHTPELQWIGVLANPLGEHVWSIGVRDPATYAFTDAAVVLGGVDPVLLLGAHGALLRSVDGGPLVPDDVLMDALVTVDVAQLSLAEVDGPQNVSALVTPPRFIDQVFATTKSGELWFSSDRGRTWAALRTDLPPANDLAFARAR